jgi:hypothetical protein
MIEPGRISPAELTRRAGSLLASYQKLDFIFCAAVGQDGVLNRPKRDAAHPDPPFVMRSVQDTIY